MGRQEKLKKIKKEQEIQKKEKKKKLIKSILSYSFTIFLSIVTALGAYYGYQKLTYKKPEIKSYKTDEKQYSQAPDMQINQSKEYIADIETDYGTIKVKLYTNEAPKTSNNFIVLAKDGFYNDLTFHRIIKDFMIQGGDPKGDGTGGPGYKFEDELPTDKSYNRGIVAMANSGKNTNGSQFFIMHKDNPDLPKNYSIFGEVIEGIDVVDKIAETEVKENQSKEKSTPISKIEIKNIKIVEK